MQTILLDFLAANLLPVVEDDSKLKHLELAAEDLAKEFLSDPILPYRCALVGLDEQISIGDPVHKKVEGIIAARWPTIVNKTGGDPVQVHRAVLLRALEIAGSKRPDLKFAVTLIVRNLQGQLPQGKSQNAIAAMISSWDSGVTNELNTVWVNPIDGSVPKISGKVKKPQINKDDLILGLGRAAGPNDKDSKPYTDANPHWPNAAAPWSHEFVPRAAEAILAAIQSSGKAHVEEIQEALREVLAGLSTNLENMAVRDAKTELLWIRTSQYSPSARTGFRSLDSINIALHATVDVSRMVTKNAPPSVEYFLRDLVAHLTSDKAPIDKVLLTIGPKISAWPEGISISSGEKLGAHGRRSWLDCAVRGFDSEGSFEQLGMSNGEQLPVSEISVRIYRELQIRKLLVSGS